MSTTQSTLTETDEEPWKDEETLREQYHDKDLDQGEIAEKFETTASTISYWMNKFEIETIQTNYEEEESTEKPECMNYEECGNKTAHYNLEVCDSCLDAMRAADR